MKGTRNIFITILIITLVVWGAFLFFLSRISAVNNQIANLTTKEEIASREQISTQNLQNMLKSSQPNIKKLDGYLVTNNTIVDFIQTLEGTAKLAGVALDINSVELKGANRKVIPKGSTVPANQKTSNSTNLVIQMASQGNFSDTFYFISLFENLPFKITINSMDIGTQTVQSKTSSDKIQTTTVWKGNYQISIAAQT